MEILDIKATKHTPKILLDADDLSFNISGTSMPENAEVFYQPVIEWLEEFMKEIPKTSAPLSVTINFDYYNSGSMRYIAELFKRIHAIHQNGMKIIIDWYYEEEDELLREAGEELQDITGLPFNFIVA